MCVEVIARRKLDVFGHSVYSSFFVNSIQKMHDIVLWWAL